MMYNLFVYRSLRDPSLCKKVMGKNVERLPAVLSGFRRKRLRGYAYPLAAKDSKATIRGVLLSGLSKDNLELVDRYEEIPHGPYKRVAVIVHAQKRRVRAHVYIDNK